jgi:hypothetical protein
MIWVPYFIPSEILKRINPGKERKKRKKRKERKERKERKGRKERLTNISWPF